MPLFGSTKNYTTLQEYLTEYNIPTGVEGQGNYVLGAGATDRSTNIGAPIAGSIGDEAFAPYFNFAAPGNSSGASGAQYDAAAYASARPDLVNNWNNALDYMANPAKWADDPNVAGVASYGSLDNYLRANWAVAPLVSAPAPSVTQPPASAPASASFDAAAYAAARPDLVNNWNNALDYRANPAKWADDPNVARVASYGSLDNYLRADWTSAGSPVIAPTTSTNSIGQFGGAVQGQGVVGGQITAPLASGNDAVALQITSGAGVGGDVLDSSIFTAPVNAPVTGDLFESQILTGPVTAPVIGGDVFDSPIVSAPLSGPATFGEDSPIVTGTGSGIFSGGDVLGDVQQVSDVLGTVAGGDILAPVVTNAVSGGSVGAPITAGEDLTLSAPVIVGNSGPVTIQTSDPAVAIAAIQAANNSLSASLDYANRALTVVAEARRDPGEKIATEAQNLAQWAVWGALALAASLAFR